MLHPVEVLPHARRSLRRAVHLDARVVASRWDEPRLHRAADLSADGMRLAAGTRLRPGEEVVVSFVPPGWWVLGELCLFARVARAEARRGAEPAWLGLEFLDLAPGARDQLARALRGRPPPLPRRTAAPLAREMVWVDTLVTYTEDLGDRVNTIEVSERLGEVRAEQLSIRPLADLLTGPTPLAARAGS